MQKQHRGGKRGQKPRNEPPKVWHNPDVVVGPRVASDRQSAESRPRVVLEQVEGDGKRRGSRRLAATDAAPFVHRAASSAPQPAGRAPASAAPEPPPSKPEPRSQRRIAVAQAPSDPKVIERERLLARLLDAEGRPAISRAVDAIVSAGHELPDEQGVLLQLLEHSRESYVQTAIEKLATILANEPCKRLTVLDSRLRRLEEYADEPELRASARDLRRQVRSREDEA